MDEIKESTGNEISRREALGLFKAVAVLGAGLAISRHALGSQAGGYFQHKYASQQLKLMPGEGAGPYCRFYVTSHQGKDTGPAIFAVQLPAEMIGLLESSPNANVQAKFFMHQIKGESLMFGDGSVRLNQGMIQSKGFRVQGKI